MKASKDLGANVITTFGDSELVVQQVKKVYQVKQPKLRNYVHEVWKMVEKNFSTFNITHVSRNENQLVDSLAIAANTFKIPMNLKSTYDVQVKHRPSMSDNIKHWKIFQDDQHIKKFLECVDDFFENQVDQDQEDCKPIENWSLENMFARQKIMKLKRNHIPKGLVPLERLFDNNDV